MNYINSLESLLRREQSYRLAFVLTNLRISNLLYRLHVSVLPRTLSCEMIVDSLVLFVCLNIVFISPHLPLGYVFELKAWAAMSVGHRVDCGSNGIICDQNPPPKKKPLRALVIDNRDGIRTWLISC